MNAGDITAANIDTNVLNSQQVVAGRSLKVGNLNLDANAKPASGSGMFVVGAADAGGAGNTAGDIAFGNTSEFVSFDVSSGILTIQGEIVNIAEIYLKAQAPTAAGWRLFGPGAFTMTGQPAGIYAFVCVGGGGGGAASNASRGTTRSPGGGCWWYGYCGLRV